MIRWFKQPVTIPVDRITPQANHAWLTQPATQTRTGWRPRAGRDKRLEL